MHLLTLAVLGASVSSAVARQVILDNSGESTRLQHDSSRWTVFNNTIKRVAVIGAGKNMRIGQGM